MIYDIGSNDNNFQAEIKCSVKAFNSTDQIDSWQ